MHEPEVQLSLVKVYIYIGINKEAVNTSTLRVKDMLQLDLAV